jgi:hypothetical protein
MIDIYKLKIKILNSLNVKSNKELKKKLFQFNSLEKFIIICAPFIFHEKIGNPQYSKINYFRRIFQNTIKIKDLLLFVCKCFLNQIIIVKPKFEKKIFFFSNRITDQYNIFPLSNELEKRNIKHTLLFNGNVNTLKKIKNKFKKEIYEIRNLLIFSDLFKGYLNFKRKKKEIIKLCKTLNFKNYKKKKIFSFFLYFFIYLELYRRVLKNKKIDMAFANKFNNPYLCALIYYLKHEKHYKNFLSISYALIGIGPESGLYIHTNSDIILVPSKQDVMIFNKLKQNKLLISSKPKLKVIGSVRNEIIKNKFYKKKSKKINILYIKSNFIHYNFIDDLALKMFVKVVKKYHKKINFYIKDRYLEKSKIIQLMLKENLIKKINIVNNKELFLEKSIINSDICVGTSSSGLTKQTFWLNKPSIQLLRNKIFFDKSVSPYKADNENELNILLKKVSQKNYLQNMNLTSKKIYKKFYLVDQSPIKNFCKYISKLQK